MDRRNLFRALIAAPIVAALTRARKPARASLMDEAWEYTGPGTNATSCAVSLGDMDRLKGRR